MTANRKFKDSVFSSLFSEPNVLRELYCALEGVTLPDDIPVTINTLQDVLFKGLINDVSFEIGGKLVILIEHQSTINPNMALRLLMYITHIYEQAVGDRNIYSTKRLAICRPEFFVLYNGPEPYPAETMIKLSDSFESIESLGIDPSGKPALELEVKVLNINAGMNEAIAKRCKTLGEYSAFVAKEREFEKSGIGREKAIKAAVQYCREHDILKEYLEKNSAEVMNMLLTEWKWEDALAVCKEEAWEEGREEGREEGKQEGKQEGIAKVARNALAKGLPLEVIHDITGLDMDSISNMQMTV